MLPARWHAAKLLPFVLGMFLLAGCQTSHSTSSTSSSSSSPSNGSSGSSSASPAPGPVIVYPGSVSVPVNGKVQFTAFLPSAPTSTFTWSVASGGGTIGNTGAYTAPAGPGTVVITATSSAGATLTGTATLNVSAAQGVQLSPAAVSIPAGATLGFTATVNGTAAAATWEVNGSTGGDGLHGTIDTSGNYTAPLTPPPGGTTTITAISGSGASAVFGTATVAVVFSNASLNGSYAYSYQGNNSSGFTAVAGSFIAQGSSSQIYNGVQDVHTAGSAAPAKTQFSGTFAVNPDGTATATLPGSVSWEFALVANPVGGAARRARMIRFDTSSTGSGTIEAQNSAQLSAAAFSGNYAFGLAGVDSGGLPLALAGRFFADGVSTIPPGSAVQDINDNGKSTFNAAATTTTTTTADTTLQGTFQMDASAPGSGRGTLTFSSTDTSVFTAPTTLQFVFYMVDTTHLKVVETDNNAALAGDFYSAVNTPADGAFNSAGAFPNGGYAFTASGSGTNGAYAVGGILTAGGATSSGSSGTVSGVLDVNNGIGDIRLNSTITSSSYSVDTNFGRITLPLNVNGATANFAGYTASYLDSSNNPVLLIILIELDAKAIASGVAYPQASTSMAPGSYALSFAGSSGPKGSALEQDTLGQLTVSATLFGGDLFIDNLASGSLTPHVALNSNSTIVSSTSNGRGTATIATSIASFAVSYYVVDANSVLLLETDGARVTTGAISKQY
jgi:hypothetical protein